MRNHNHFDICVTSSTVKQYKIKYSRYLYINVFKSIEATCKGIDTVQFKCIKIKFITTNRGAL